MNGGALKHRYGVMFLCLGCLSVILTVVLTTDGLGPIDDHQFIRTIFQGQKFGTYILPELGRFIPLTAQEYCFIAKFFNPTPVLFHIISAFKVLLAGLLLFHCLSLTKTCNLAVAILWSTVMLSIGFTNAAIRLQVGEINALVLIIIFVWSFLATEKNAIMNPAKHYILVGCGLLALSTALFYKELIFVFAVAFAASEIVRKYRQRGAIPRYLWILLGIGVSYLIFYMLWRTVYATGSYANFHTRGVWSVAQDYAKNDPFIVFVAMPLTLFRLAVFIRNAARQSIFDSLLVASVAYFAAYLTLGMFNTYYLLPAYGFAVCGVAGVLTTRLSSATKLMMLLLSGSFVINNAPVAISDMQTLKLTANNHYRFVKFISEWIQLNPLPNSERRNLVLAGVSPGSGVEILISLKTFLVSFGVPESAFDVMATEPSDNKSISDFHGLTTNFRYQNKKNDLIIFNPYQGFPISPPLQSPSYKEIYRSDKAWALPRWTIRRWLKFCLAYHSNFVAKMDENMRYSGYTTMLATRTLEPTSDAQPLEAPAYRIDAPKIPSHIHAGTIMNLEVTVQNIGTETWPADGTLRSGMLVHLAYRWFDQNNQMILEGDRAPFPEPIRPNDSVKIPVEVKTPLHPGKYKLEIVPVQEGVSWFKAPNGIEIDIF